MFGIRNLLFGKKVAVNVPDLGIFKARVKRDHLKEISWTGNFTSKTKNEELFLLLLGNGKGPYQNEIETVKFILKDEENIKTQVANEILKDIKLQQKFQGQKMEDFHLTTVYPWKANEISYELSFETKIGEQYIIVIHTGKKVASVSF